MQIDPAGVSLADKLARYEAVRRRLRESDRRAVQASASYSETLQQQVFVNRAGMVTQQMRRTTLALILFVSDGQQQRYDYLGRGGTGGLEMVEISEEALAETAEIGGRAAHRAPGAGRHVRHRGRPVGERHHRPRGVRARRRDRHVPQGAGARRRTTSVDGSAPTW